MLDDSTTAYAVGTCALLLLASFLLLQPTGLVKWLQKKNYQYEVTFALYMLTPTEKFIFSTPPSQPPSLQTHLTCAIA